MVKVKSLANVGARHLRELAGMVSVVLSAVWLAAWMLDYPEVATAAWRGWAAAAIAWATALVAAYLTRAKTVKDAAE